MQAPLLRLLLASIPFLAACAGAPPPPEASVKPGINTNFLDPALSVEEWMARFEVESREIFAQRTALARSVGLEPGDRVADVGAGTGLFLEPLAEAVGTEGRVYALDISPVFVEHLTQRARALGLSQVVPRLCAEDSLDLPKASLDKAFVCDTYHHFEYPRRTMASLHGALRSGGEVVIVDFERIPGVSREWVLDHVRCGKGEVIAEVEGDGFELVEELALPGLAENYVLRFRRP